MRLAFVVGIMAIGLVASTTAQADYAVVMFKDGYCRPWSDSKATPIHAGWKYHWVGLKSWGDAAHKKHYAMKRHWCKEFM